jgi:hypothetical protein
MSEVPTAKEIIEKHYGDCRFGVQISAEEIAEWMIECATLHCKAQREAIIEKAKAGHTYPYTHNEPYVDKESIRKAYPLNKIK